METGGKRTVYVLPPCHSVILRILLFISFRSTQQSNQLTKSCMDFLSFIFWNNNMIMIIVQTINTLREMKGLNFDS